MTKHNEDILNFLNDYMKVSKPGYAVLLKGSWGCGKTYFIKDWRKVRRGNSFSSERRSETTAISSGTGS